MGDMEMIDKYGVRATFTENGVDLDLVPFSECCEMCNDPRMMNVNGVKKCVVCHSVHSIGYEVNE
jgi:hypothetical protein